MRICSEGPDPPKKTKIVETNPKRQQINVMSNLPPTFLVFVALASLTLVHRPPPAQVAFWPVTGITRPHASLLLRAALNSHGGTAPSRT
jgi:hypothetical protein